MKKNAIELDAHGIENVDDIVDKELIVSGRYHVKIIDVRERDVITGELPVVFEVAEGVFAGAVHTEFFSMGEDTISHLLRLAMLTNQINPGYSKTVSFVDLVGKEVEIKIEEHSDRRPGRPRFHISRRGIWTVDEMNALDARGIETVDDIDNTEFVTPGRHHVKISEVLKRDLQSGELPIIFEVVNGAHAGELHTEVFDTGEDARNLLLRLAVLTEQIAPGQVVKVSFADAIDKEIEIELEENPDRRPGQSRHRIARRGIRKVPGPPE